ncbi:MAG: metal-dependent transcriptional regulator [Thermoplasmata archaeon]|nr:metal-dependent transcriptional regulator [Thermoplasmata archaeon]
MTTIRAEHYLEAINEVIEKKQYAKVNDVAQKLDVGLSSVTEMFQKLSAEGLINYEKYSGVTLTTKGKRIINKLTKKHGTLKEFLLILGVDKDTAEADACRIEHVVDSKTIEKLIKFVGFVKYRNEMPNWLEHFKLYEETGKLPECTIKCKGDCPIHNKKK